MRGTAHLWFGLALAGIVLGGCGTKRPPAADAAPAARDLPAPPAPSGRDASHGITHTVSRGETLYSIARAYGKEVEELARINNLADASRLEVGQQLFIPGATEHRSGLPAVAGGDRSRVILAWPVRGEILSPFGAPRPGRTHEGLDIRGRNGEPVVAAAAGKVIFSGTMRGYGKVVILDHGGGLETRYAHNKKLLVRAGQRVSRGQKIATVGHTGNATGDHVHFEVRRNKVAVDPVRYLGN
jgi:murein DD-endopeptidase MepM/ murein hydrolase activator NlpD